VHHLTVRFILIESITGLRQCWHMNVGALDPQSDVGMPDEATFLDALPQTAMPTRAGA
jgi:hypothetical protein